MSDQDQPQESIIEEEVKEPVRRPLFAEEPDPDEYFKADEEAARAAALKKNKQLALFGTGFFVTLMALIVYSCQPPKGTIMYGVCAAFLEQIVHYPPTIKHLYVEQFPRAVRIYFNQIDAFGQFTNDTIECSADPKAYPNLRFDKVLYNRHPVDQEKIARFNPTIPVIIASEPDLTLPELPQSY